MIVKVLQLELLGVEHYINHNVYANSACIETEQG